MNSMGSYLQSAIVTPEIVLGVSIPNVNNIVPWTQCETKKVSVALSKYKSYDRIYEKTTGYSHWQFRDMPASTEFELLAITITVVLCLVLGQRASVVRHICP